ncbi:hypothetical protein [Tamlana flava]|uniref:hypothetical protein n=1 Tax=Tamlana flava TaxID=3158572 RepID=UPI00351B20BF
MKTQKAIKILNEQSEKLKKLELFTTHNWTVETRTYLTEFFGKESYQAEHFRMNLTDIKSDQKKEQIIDFLNDCVNIISNKGLYKPPTENWFSKLPNWAINLGLPALCFISFSVGILFTNNNNSELRKENSELKEQLLLISSDTIPNNHKDLSDKPK